jgi:extracellular solute-binding protein/von Willebrand factor type A domain-containing protein
VSGRNDPPGEPGNGGYDPTRPVFGPANDGPEEDWFAYRDQRPGDPRRPGGGSGPTIPPNGGFSGTSDPGGRPRPAGAGGVPQRRPGPPPADSPYERPFPTGAPRPSSGRDAGAFSQNPSGSPYDRPFPTGAPSERDREADAFSGGGYRDHDSISGSGGYGGGGYRGGGGSGGPGSGDDEYGRRRKRSVAALIGPMAGAVGLALLLGVGVYALAGSGGGCSGDNVRTLDVAVAPDIRPALTKTISRFNDKRHKIDGACVRADVRTAEPSAVTTLLSGQSVPTGSNAKPDVWIPDSSMWVSLVRTSPKGKNAVQVTKTSVASTPIVVGMPRTLAGLLKQQGITASPSWDNLLNAAGGTPGGAVTKNKTIPAKLVRLYVPEPTRNAAGMGALTLTNTLLTNDPNKDAIFTGIIRTVRENTAPSVKAQFASFGKDRQGRYPIALASEQAVWSHNRGNPAEPAVAVYPLEGTLNLDYPFTVTAGGDAERRAAKLLEQAINTEPTRGDVRGLGFRSADGKAPSTFGDKTGVSPQRPKQLPAPQPAKVQGIMQAWSKLSLSIRALALIDISGTMAEPIAPGVTRLEATAQTAQTGLTLLPNDTELGVWTFSTRLVGDQDWRELVPLGPLGQRIGSNSRRQSVISGLSAVRPKRTGDTGLFETVMAAYKHMTRSYKPEFGNSILLLTDGVGNDDPGGPSLQATLRRLRELRDDNRPVQVIMIGIGENVQTGQMERIAEVTGGSVHVAKTPAEIQKIFLAALARRIKE